MNVTVYGAGYVGLVSAVCLAELGHHVYCLDIDQNRVDLLNCAQVPIYEAGLAALLQKNMHKERIHFTTDAQAAVDFGAVQIIAVGTPATDDGAVDMRHVYSVATTIGSMMTRYSVIVTKSTVPVGTAQRLQEIISTALAKRKTALEFDVVSNPEFLKEGAAVADFMNPDRIIVGAKSQRALAIIRELYEPLLAKKAPLVVMSERSAEFTKYAANAFLATKISFMNEMSRLAERIDVDIEDIKKAVGLDKRIGEKFLNPGCGFGGSCFPKDVSALESFARALDCEAHITAAVLKTNALQKRLLFDKIRHYFAGDLKNKVVALWGLAFKPNTDDVRCAPSRTLIELLWREGARVQAYDPLAMHNIEALYGSSPQLQLCESAAAALHNADVLAIVTEWEHFKNPDFSKIKHALKNPVIFDGRNLYVPSDMKRKGFVYFPIGRGVAQVPAYT